MNANLKQLKAFVAVYQTRKFSLAAERLFLTHSAVSVMVRQLEDEIGQKLFDRTTRTLRPTPAGDELYPIAERVLRDLAAIGQHFTRFSAASTGIVRLAVTPALAVSLVPWAVRELMTSHPGVQVVVEDCGPDQFVERINSDTVDFGLGTPELVTSDLECEALIKDQLCIVCAASHELAREEKVRWVDLDGQPIIAVKAGYGIRRSIDAAAAEAGVSLRFAHEVSFLTTALAFAAEGLGVAILPSSLVPITRYPHLVARRLSAPTVTRDVSIVRKQGTTLSPASAAFIALLRTALANGRLQITQSF